MRTLLVVFLAVALVLPAALQPKEASACWCGNGEGIEAVFHGRVGRTIEVKSFPRGGEARTVEVEVLRVFKGKPYATRYTTYTVNHSECDYTLARGQEFIFRIWYDQKEFGTSNCTVSLATEENISELGRGFPPRPNFGQPSTLPLSAWSVAAIFGALVVSSFAVVLIRNWRAARQRAPE